MNDFVTMENIALIDVHSHVLPSIDDGSQSVEESLQMLSMSKASGVGRMIATPHFYPDETDPKAFLEKRERAAKALAEAINNAGGRNKFPLVGLGAEVAFFKGISRSSAIKDLRILGTDLILIEMPFERWSASVLDEILSIKSTLGLLPVVAHVERYFAMQSKSSLAELFSGEVLIQMNAEAFLERKTAKRALSELKRGNIDLLGSDSHNTSCRAPNLDKAVAVIENKLGRETVDGLKNFGSRAFENSESIF